MKKYGRIMLYNSNRNTASMYHLIMLMLVMLGSEFFWTEMELVQNRAQGTVARKRKYWRDDEWREENVARLFKFCFEFHV